MKFSQTTLLALLATASFVQAAPTAVNAGDSTQLVRRADVNQALSILADLKATKQKRSLVEDPEEALALAKREDSLIAQLISALANSGIVSEVWNTLSNDADLKSEIASLVKSAISGLAVHGPALIKAIWNSGLLKNIFNTLINDDDLKSVLLSVAKSLFSTGLNLIKNAVGGSSSSSTAATKRDVVEVEDIDYLDKRDIADVVSTIVSAIKDSGIVSSLVNKVLADPEASISFLTSVLKKGVVLIEDVYDWAKDSGLLVKGLNYIAENGGKYAGTLASFLSDLISNGTISTSDIDDADDLTSSTTTTKAATTTATGVTTTTTSTGTATAAALLDDDSIAAAASKAEAALNNQKRAAPTTLQRVRRMY